MHTTGSNSDSHPRQQNKLQMLRCLLEHARSNPEFTITIIVRDALEIRKRHLEENRVAEKLGLKPEQLQVMIVQSADEQPEGVDWSLIIAARRS